MTIICYNISDDKRRIYKTLTGKQVTTISGTLREGCDLLNPEITVELASLPTFNYCYIADFGNRYYWVDSIRIINNKLYRLSLSVDVLMSYRVGIESLRCVVARNETNYNLLLRDDQMPFSTINSKQSITFTAGADDFKWYNIANNANDYCFIVTIAGKLGGYSASSETNDTPFKTPLDPRLHSTGYNTSWIVNGANMVTFLNALSNTSITGIFDKLFGVTADAVVSITLLPFVTLPGGTTTNMTINGVTLKDADDNNPKGWVLETGRKVTKTLGSFQFTPSVFFKADGMANLQIWAPYVGWAELAISDVSNGGVCKLQYIVDLPSGDAIACVTNEDGDIIWQQQCSVGVKIPITNSNAAQVAQNYLNAGMRGAMALVSGNVAGGLGAFVSASINPVQFRGQPVVPNMARYEDATPKVYLFYPSPDIPSYYEQFYGRPYMETVTLSTIKNSGFTIVDKLFWGNADEEIPTQWEKDEINRILTTGFYLNDTTT